MVAKNAIFLGMVGQGSQPFPVRLYTPKSISMTTQHLSVGDIQILVEPAFGGFIYCKKLTLLKSEEKEPDAFEIIKSWVMNDDAEIETVSRVPLSS